MSVGVVRHYPSIPRKAVMKALKNALKKREQKQIRTDKLIWQNVC